MRRWKWLLIGISAALAGEPAAGQTAQSATEQAPIVVEGRRDRDTEIRELVDALPPAAANGHISRFEHEACPAALGLPPAQRDLVVSRMRAVASAAGVPLAGANCRANVLLLVTTDKRELIEQLIRRFPVYLGDLNRHQARHLAQDPGPTALWHLSGRVDADGRQLMADEDGVFVQRTTRHSSRISDQGHREFIGSVLVVETRALSGLTTTQLADYAAMRTFSGADPARLAGRHLSTILTLLDAPMGSEVPITLTSWDLAFLGSLYRSNASTYAPSQRGEIRNGISRTLERSADPAPHR